MFQRALLSGGGGGEIVIEIQTLSTSQTYQQEMLSGCIYIGINGSPLGLLIVENGQLVQPIRVNTQWAVLTYDTTTHIATYKDGFGQQGDTLVVAYNE